MWTTFCTGAVSRWRPHASAVGSLCSPMGFLPLTTLSRRQEVSDYRARRQRQRHARQLHACIIPEGETGEIIDEDAQLPQKPLIASSVVKSDPYFQELGVLRDALVVEGREVNAPAIQCVEEQMRRRMQQLRSDERKAGRLRRAESSGFWSSTRTWMVWRSQAFPLVNSGFQRTRSLRARGGTHGARSVTGEERRGSGGEGAVFEGACRAAGCCSSEAGGCAARADAVPDASSI
ncbi:hypothetical protein C3747_465g38 [Trypanosoma cruzi]|uniref:Uncharacterized protein n=1 Tax=Trypanosoma cruzi TaxID=5693 RepID=A0A2V2UUG9_TRYCR|nr:hypothetical protein C3747_465g38 [Trypanosoma cruzi]